MTKKDFELIVNTLITFTSGPTRGTLLCEFARVFKANHPNFDQFKWFNYYMKHKALEQLEEMKCAK